MKKQGVFAFGSNLVQQPVQSSTIRPCFGEDLEKYDEYFIDCVSKKIEAVKPGKQPGSGHGKIIEGVDMDVDAINNMVKGWETNPGSTQVQNPAQPADVKAISVIVYRKQIQGRDPKELKDLELPEVVPSPDMLKLPRETNTGPIKKKICQICLKDTEHMTAGCPYQQKIPLGAEIGPAASKICFCCNKRDAHHDEWAPGRAVLKHCWICGKWWDHWDEMCPEKGKRPHPFETLYESVRELNASVRNRNHSPN